MPPRNDDASGTFTGRHMLIIMVAFFGVIIAVNVTMAVLAGRSWTGLVVKNSYVASQHFNEQLEEAKRQRARGWRSEVRYEDGALAFKLRDRNGKPVALANVSAVIGRPASEQHDRVIGLETIGAGDYRGSTVLGPGHWQVRITGGAGEDFFRRDLRLFLKKTAASSGDGSARR